MNKKLSIRLAEQQLIGFSYAEKGYGILDLIEAMALTEKEWEELKKTMGGWLRPIDIQSVDEFFKQQKQ